MKIALVVPGFSQHERDWCIPALLDYVRGLALQADVHVYALRWPERRAQYAVYGAQVRALDGRPSLGARAPVHWARAVRAVAADHRAAPFDVIHAFWADESGWVATLAGALLRRPVLISLAGGELTALPDLGYGLQTLPGRRALVTWILRRAAVVSAGSRYMLNLARGFLPAERHDRLAHAPLGVDLARFFPPPSPQALAPPMLVNAGALYPVKDQALLLRVLARLPGARLQLAGEGPLREALQGLAEHLNVSHRVKFLGQVDHADLANAFRAGSIYVQTSRHEAQGMAVLEAAACGLAVTGTPVGVLPEVGLAAAGEDALVQTLRGLLDDPAGRAAHAEASRAHVVSGFALPAAIDRFVELYALCASGSGTP